MNKQIQGSSILSPRLPHHEDVANDVYKEIKSEEVRKRPEISIYPAEKVPVEIDSYTGLPKLPVELPPPSPEVEHRALNLQSAQDQYKVLASALKMTTTVLPGAQRKSVSFVDPTDNKTTSSGSPKYKERVSFVF